MNLAGVSTREIMEELARRTFCEDKPQKYSIFFGPPGAGKGTQAPIAKDEHCLCHLSTGDMLRAAVSAGTTMGKKAKSVMDAGELVGDDIVAGIVAEAIEGPECRNGFILDGFPRTLNQAKMLDKMLVQQNKKIDKVINLSIADDLLVKRITGRLIHTPSGRSYNTYFNPPKKEGLDDITGEPLTKRKDDNEKALQTRLKAFHEATQPILQHYGKSVHNINANQHMAVVTDDVRRAMNK